MEDKEKQIEEMANCKNCVHEDICQLRTYSYCEEEVKEKGCEHYQPKLPEDSVVLSREEYKLLFDIKKKFETADGDEITAVSLLMWLKELTAQERKEAAEKIIDLIKTFCPDKKFIETISHIISERFGVEIKE
jgi:hypothetical protein